LPSKIDKYKLSREHDRRCKVSEEEVIKIQELYFMGFGQQVIADTFGISQQAVSYLVNDRSRANLADYRRWNPPKNRSKAEAREYSKALRAYKKKLIENEKEKTILETSDMDSM
jgi:predicted transcriptional regulator